MTDKQVQPVKTGRPSKYNADTQRAAEQYLSDFREQGDVIPSNAGLCCWLGVARSTVHEWAKIHPAFSGTLDAISVMQESLALNRSLTGEFNPTISKLILANHGYSDKVEQNHTSTDGSLAPSRIELVAPSLKD